MIIVESKYSVSIRQFGFRWSGWRERHTKAESGVADEVREGGQGRGKGIPVGPFYMFYIRVEACSENN